MNKALLFSFVVTLSVLSPAWSEVITVAPEYEDRYEKLLHELRCLVCQNQTVAESASGLANDLRVEVKEMLERGASDEEILTFMSDRYGDFVLYKPPVEARTYFLWAGPFILLVGGIFIAVMLVRRKSHATPQSRLSDQDRQRLRSLLEDKDIK